MLKILKHEWLETWRLLLGAVGATVAIVAVGVLGHWVQVPALSGFFYLAGIFVPVILVTAVFAYLIWRYYTTMFGRRGYLTHVLPVSGARIYWAKILYITAWMLVVLGVAIASWLVFFRVSLSQDMWASLKQEFIASFGSLHKGVLIGIIVVAVLMSFGQSILYWTTGLTLGNAPQLSRFGHYAGMVISLVALYVIGQVVAVVGLFAVPVSLRIEVPIGLEFGYRFLQFVNERGAVPLVPFGFIVTELLFYAVMIAVSLRVATRHISLR
ncbi:MAG: hypothetical protein Q4G30_09150 [Actinomycetaceae bacterium]|nr:hypothetical protein [Actinomycetaceae bacterium]